MSYDINVFAAPPDADINAAWEALTEAEEAGVAPPPADRGLIAALREQGFEPVGGGSDDQVQLDDGVISVLLDGTQAYLNFPYWGSTDAERLADRVFGVVALLHERAGWRAYDPQLDRELLPGDRAQFLEKFAYGVGIVDEIARGDTPAAAPERKRPWWRRLG
jgi:hypothetical protein